MANSDNLASLALAFLGTAGNQNVAANGYQKLPSGLLIQWGSIVVTASGSASGNQTVTLPTSWTVGPYQIITAGQNVATPAAGVEFGWLASTLADFSLRWACVAPGQLSGGTVLSYVAIGK